MGIDKPPFVKTYLFEKGNCLFFYDLLTMMSSISSLMFAMELIQKKGSPILEFKDEQLMRIELPFAGITVKNTYAFKPYTPLKNIATNIAVNKIEFEIYELPEEDVQATNALHWVNELYELQQRFIAASFINFYENNLDTINTRYSTNSQNWAPVLNFARVIRNACSHGGVIHFNNAAAAPVFWQGLTYSPAENGHSIFNDIYVPEIIELFLEMESLLIS